MHQPLNKHCRQDSWQHLCKKAQLLMPQHNAFGVYGAPPRQQVKSINTLQRNFAAPLDAFACVVTKPGNQKKQGPGRSKQ